MNAPTVVSRGSEFELDITLDPTPVEPVNLIVESSNNLVTPGSERVIFGVEQSLANEAFYVPDANVGQAELIFRSRSLRDYSGPNCEPLAIYIDVQGELSTNLDGAVIGTTRTVPVTVFLHPPAAETIVVDIETNGFGTAPGSVTLNRRDSSVTFDFTVTAAAFTPNACVTFSTAYYASTTACFDIAGIFSSNIDDTLNTYSVESFTVTANPPADYEELVVDITTTSNVNANDFAYIQPFEDTAEFQIDSLTTGRGWIEFSAPGYITERYDFTIIEVDCDDDNQVISQSGFLCLNCPSTNGVVCSNHGECLYSFFASELARCVCDDGWFGPQCQFSGEPSNLMIVDFTRNGIFFTTQLIPATYSTEITIPFGLLQDGENGMGVFYLQAYNPDHPFYGAIDPLANPPTVENSIVEQLPSGFNFDIVSYDNTEVGTLDLPISYFFEFDRRVISQRDIIQIALYYWAPGVGWIPNSEVCPDNYVFEQSDILAYTYRTNICHTGQYQFFIVRPDPAHTISVKQFYPNERFVYDDLEIYYPNVGLGGIRGVEPPQPEFHDPHAPVDQQASLPSSYTEPLTAEITLSSTDEASRLNSSSSSASTLTISMLAIFGVILAFL